MQHLKRIFEPKDYAEALQMANASNVRAIVNWLAARIDKAAAVHPNDGEYVNHVHLMAKHLNATNPMFEHHVCVLWRMTWTEDRWMIANDPAIALAVQVIGNITQLECCRYGIAPSSLYDWHTSRAELMAYMNIVSITPEDEGVIVAIRFDEEYPQRVGEMNAYRAGKALDLIYNTFGRWENVQYTDLTIVGYTPMHPSDIEMMLTQGEAK